MKATLQIDAPKSCRVCPIESLVNGNHFCQLINGTRNTEYCTDHRHPDCPLVIELET